MTKIIRTIYSFFLRLWRVLHGFRFGIASYGIRLTNNERKLLDLKDRYPGRRAFVVGGGPSLCHTDVRRLKNEITIGSNGIFLLSEETGFRPTFYTVEDRLVAEDRAPVINKLAGMIKVFPIDLCRFLKPDEDTIYINFVRGQYPGFPSFSQSFARRVYWGGTVTFLNLQLAYYLGIREVYLIGMDHEYKPPTKTDEVDGVVITSRSTDVNHFHPDYFGPGYRWHDPKVERMEKAYLAAREFSLRDNMRIFNATSGGKLEVFPRVDYDSLFADAKR